MGFSENDCHSDGRKLSNVTRFIILRYEKGLTSLNRNNPANNFGEKSKMKLSRFVYCFRIREKKLMSNLVFIVVLVLESKAV